MADSGVRELPDDLENIGMGLECAECGNRTSWLPCWNCGGEGGWDGKNCNSRIRCGTSLAIIAYVMSAEGKAATRIVWSVGRL
ncbi:MAG: hypothetical protein C4583_04255 [Anaerolineaceae bacterium]|nr:MAG: hypothetical protein C4583_04255 [Anaerolineaceae bacterium]